MFRTLEQRLHGLGRDFTAYGTMSVVRIVQRLRLPMLADTS
jgi:hypothetical protein